MRLLLAEDNAETRDILVRMLQRLGAEVRAVASGAEALSVLDQCPRPEVVILDHFLSDMSGEEVARQIRQRDPSLPLVRLSGMDEPYEAGLFDRALVKPVRLGDLQRLFRELQLG